MMQHIPDPAEVATAEAAGLVFSDDKKTLLKFEEPLWEPDAGSSDAEWERPHYTVKIPEGVEYIGEKAFSFCHLEELVIPGSVKEIGDMAFYECRFSKGITLPGSLRSIGERAFFAHIRERLCIPSGVTSFGEGLYLGYSSNGISSDSPRYAADSSGALIDTRRHVLLYAGNVSGYYTVPAGVKRIASYAFYDNTELTGVHIPGSVEEIGEFAFAGCSQLRSVKIPDSVRKMERMAFSVCCDLENITLPRGLREIADGAFCRSGLQSMIIPDRCEKIGKRAFFECAQLSKVVFSNPGKIKSVAEDAFKYTKWSEVQSKERIRHESPGNSSVSREETTYYCPPEPECSGLNTLQEGDFILSQDKRTLIKCANKEIADAVLPAGITAIMGGAFAECNALKSVTVPESVRRIGRNAFSDCRNLVSVHLSEGVETIAQEAFLYCVSLSEVTIPASVKYIGEDAFGVTRAFQSNNRNFVVESGGVLVDRAAKRLISAPLTISGHYTVPDGIRSIGDGAFCRCHKLTGVTIPEGVEDAGLYAFCNCSNLRRVNLPESFRSADHEAFSSIPCSQELEREYPYIFPPA